MNTDPLKWQPMELATPEQIEEMIREGILWRCDCGLVLGGGCPCPRCEG